MHDDGRDDAIWIPDVGMEQPEEKPEKEKPVVAKVGFKIPPIAMGNAPAPRRNDGE